MKQLILGAALVGIGTVIGAITSNDVSSMANAQFAPPSSQSGDALWHLPKLGESGWFLHANNGRVRACNMDKVSVVGEQAAPKYCTMHMWKTIRTTKYIDRVYEPRVKL